MLLKNFLAGTVLTPPEWVSASPGFKPFCPASVPLFEMEMPNLRPCSPLTRLLPGPLLPPSTLRLMSFPPSGRFTPAASFLTGTTGLLGGRGGGTPLPRAGLRALACAACDSPRGFRPLLLEELRAADVGWDAFASKPPGLEAPS